MRAARCLTVVLLSLVAAGRGLAFQHEYVPSVATTKQTEKDSIVLADLANRTGEDALNDIFQPVLRAALEESPFLIVASPAAVSLALKDLAYPSNAPLTPKLARAVCLHGHQKVYVAGAMSRNGRQFMIGLQAVDCQSGAILADAHSTAQRKETILDALSDVAIKVRMRLGEPSESLRKFHTPLARATSGSFDALRAWSAGIKAQQGTGYAAAIPFYERAIELDPHFARALYSVGLYYRDAQQEGRARDLLSKAFAQRDRASARERFRIAGLYHSFVTVEYTKAVEAHQEWMQAYPHDEKAVASLASFYGDVCEYEKSIALFRQARQMDPNNFIVHEDLVELLAASGQFDSAREAYQEMRRRGLDDDAPHVYMFSVDFLQHDTDEMAQEAAWFDGKPLFRHEILSEHADAEAYMGHLVRARELTKQAVQSALAADNREQAAAWQLNSAWREELFGNRREAGDQAIRALSIAPESREGAAIAAIILARTGDTAKAEALAKDLESRYPQHAVVQSYWLPSIRAQVDFAEGHVAPALRELETAKRYDPLLPQVAYYSHMPSVVLRAEAYLALHQPEEAVKQWQTILQWPGIVQLSATAPIAKLKLARALAVRAGTGDSAARARARMAYQEFLLLWKDADADIPVLREAQVEFAKLQR